MCAACCRHDFHFLQAHMLACRSRTSVMTWSKRALSHYSHCTSLCLLQDSGAYFIQMLWNLYSLPGYARTALLAEPVVFEAVNLLVDIWTIEQHHEEKSKYRYSELPREGRGPLSNYTGVVVASPFVAQPCLA